MSARSALRSRLIANVPLVDRRVFESSAAPPTTEYPFLVLKGGAEDSGEVWANTAQPFEIWPYVSPVTSTFDLTPYGMLDQLVAQISAALGARYGYWFVENGVAYVAQWLGGAGDDFQDAQWNNAHTRPQRVEVASLDWLLLAHPVLDALREWTGDVFPLWTINPNGSAPSDAQPWVFWRLATMPTRGDALTLDYDWMEAVVSGHVVVPTNTSRETAVWNLAAALEVAGDSDPPTIRMPGGSWMHVVSVGATPDANPREQGQIQMTVRFLSTEIPPWTPPTWGEGGPFGRVILYASPGHISKAPPYAVGNQPAPTGTLTHERQ